MSVDINDNKLKEILNISLKQFYEKDKILVEQKGMEQACVFRIGLYLNEQLKRNPELNCLNLDCEYNKSNFGAKITPRFKKGARPDLIIHERNLEPNISNDNNIFIIEFKGWWNNTTERDIQKLEDFTDPVKGYHYRLGVFIVLTKNFEDVKFQYFKDGHRI